MNGGDKLVKGLSDNEAIVESTVNILISDVVVTEGGSGVVVTAVGVISGSKLLSVIRFITLLVELLVMGTTSDDRVLDCISVNAIDMKSVDIAGDSKEVTGELPGILVDVTLSMVEVINDTNNVSVVSKLLCILLDIISVDCITVGTITLVILMSAGSDVVDEGVMIVVKLPIVTTSVDSVNGIIELVTG